MSFSNICALSLTTGYGDTNILSGINFKVEPGEIFGILGRNGVGKSTLLKSIIGESFIFSGDLLFNGENIRYLSTHDRIKRGLAYMPQSRLVFDSLTVKENLQIISSDKNDFFIFIEFLDFFPRLKNRLNIKAGYLSGGEKKILSFCRVINQPASVILLDEPTEGVQPDNILIMQDFILRKQSNNVSFIIAEQNSFFLEKLCNTAILLDHGSIIMSRQRFINDQPLFLDDFTKQMSF